MLNLMIIKFLFNMKWIYIYKFTGGKVLHGDTILAKSFLDATKAARLMCRIAGVSLVGVMPYDVVTNQCRCIFKLDA